MRVVDAALLAMLEATGIDTNDGFVDADNSGNTVTVEYPYFQYTSSLGDGSHNPRLSGHYGRLSHYFTVMYVGTDVDQARWAGEKARLALLGKRVSGTGIGKSWLIEIDESQSVRRADDAISEDDIPLYYGVFLCSVSVTLDSTGVPG